MKCQRTIVIVRYNNGKSEIRDSLIAHKINGTQNQEICGGRIICKIYAESGYDDGCGSSPELVIEFLCERCGIRHNLDYSIEDIEKIVNNHI